MPSLEERIRASPFKVVIFAGLLLTLSGSWLLPLIDRDEPRFAEASREMLQRHDFVVPWFNGQYRFDKPPLIYWCQAAGYSALGENSFAARLPSAVFTTATAILLLVWGRRLGSVIAGLFAALIFLTSLQVLIHGRLALADMPMVFFVTAAAWSGWELTRPGASRARWWWLFFGSLGFGFLAKGPVAWLPLVGLFFARWRRPSEFRFSWPAIAGGILLSLIVVGIWGVPALVATRGQFFSVGIGRHVVYRSLGIMEGHGGAGWLGFILTLPLYFLTFFFSFFPWAFSVPVAIRQWWSSRARDTVGWYLLLQSLVVFAVFTLVRTKLPHYTMPALPLISLWLARHVQAAPASRQWLTVRVALMCSLALGITLAGFAAARPYFVAARLSRQTRNLCSPNMEIGAVGFDEPSLVWEFRRTTTNYVQHLSTEEAKAFLQKDAPRLLILPWNLFTNQFEVSTTNLVTFRSTGLDTASFRKLDLVAVIKNAN